MMKVAGASSRSLFATTAAGSHSHIVSEQSHDSRSQNSSLTAHQKFFECHVGLSNELSSRPFDRVSKT